MKSWNLGPIYTFIGRVLEPDPIPVDTVCGTVWVVSVHQQRKINSHELATNEEVLVEE